MVDKLRRFWCWFVGHQPVWHPRDIGWAAGYVECRRCRAILRWEDGPDGV